MYQYYSHMYGSQWETHMGISNLAKVVGSEPPCNIVTQTQPGLYASATKSLVSLQGHQHDHQHQIEVPSWNSGFPKTTDSTVMFCQDRPTSQFTGSSHSFAESFLSSSADGHSSSEKCSEFPSYSQKQSDFQPRAKAPIYEHLPQEHDKLLRDDGATDGRPLEVCFQRSQLASCTKPEKQYPRPCGVSCVTASSNSVSRRASSDKRRIRWTKELHEPFMVIVNRLGGPDKAKPKAILEMMKSDLLSIAHVKSHLQKCRSTIYQHRALQERSEEEYKTNGVTELQVKIHMQIEESRQLQLEVRRSIHQQLEMQRNLQVLIEQQREQLKMKLEQQKERTKLGKRA